MQNASEGVDLTVAQKVTGNVLLAEMLILPLELHATCETAVSPDLLKFPCPFKELHLILASTVVQSGLLLSVKLLQRGAGLASAAM